MPVTDVELMLRIQAGDEEAFRTMWDRHARSLLNFFHWYGLSREDAEDGVQEIFQRIWLAREKYQPTGRFRSYLLRIATNYLIDRGRAIQRRPGVISMDVAYDEGEGKSQPLRDRLPGSEPAPDEPIEDQETREWWGASPRLSAWCSSWVCRKKSSIPRSARCSVFPKEP